MNATTKIFRRVLFIGALIAAPALGLHASNTDIAAAGAAGIVLGPLGLQSVAGSRLEVTVEVYRDTLKWEGYDHDGRATYKFGGDPFRLSRPLAMKAQLKHLSNTASSPTADAVVKMTDSIRGLLDQQQESLQDLRRTRDRLERDFARHDPSGKGKALVDEMDDVLNRNDQLATVFRRMQDAVSRALEDGQFTSDEVTKAADQLLAIRLIAASIPRDFSANLGGFLRSQLRAAFLGALAKAPEAPGVDGAKVNTFDQLAELPTIDTSAGQKNAIDDLLWEFVEKVRALKNDNWHIKMADAKVHIVAADDIAKAVEGVLRSVGYRAEFNKLLGITDRKEFETRWGEEANAIQRAAAVPIQIADLVYTGVSIGANFGPITNEVIQGVLTENDLIDRVTSGEDRWTRYNYAYSRGGAGNHNAIVYFDNMLTPILKSAAFDPSLFLAANAQVYKRATLVLSNVVGAPLAKDAEATGSGLESLNLLDLKARKHKAVKAAAAERGRMLAVVKLVLDEHATLAGKHVNPPSAATPAVPAIPAHDNQPEQPAKPAENAKPSSWKDEVKAKTYLHELVQSLEETATRLEQH